MESSVKRSLLLVLLVWSLLVTPAVTPGQKRTTPPAAPRSTAAAPARAKAVPLAEAVPFVNKTLSNGLEIVVLEDHSVPLVTVELAVRNGSFTEPPELNGLSHLYEHMFFKANRATSNKEDYLQTIDQLGIMYNGQTQQEIVNYYFTTTTPNLPVAMHFMRDAVRYPLFDERQFEQEREVVIGELDRHESNPFGFLDSEMNNRLFYKYPSRKDPGGNKQTVASATTDQMRLIQGRYYVPNNSAIIVTGDISAPAAFSMVEELFGDWPRRAIDPFNEIAHFNDPDYFTDEQLESAKALLEADDLYSREKVDDYTHTIGFWWASTGLDYYRGYLGRLRATSRADISRYVNGYILGKPHVGLALMNDDAAKTSGLTADDLIGNEKQNARSTTGN